MQTTTRWACMTAAVAATVLGCSKEEPKPEATVKSAKAAPVASASAPAPAPTPTAPPIDCPKGSTGEGSFDKPCEAKGDDRVMEVVWRQNKKDEKGPTFSVKNVSELNILYGKIVLYFYDKAGKQLELKDPSSEAAKPRPYHSCSGANLFGGVMKPGEKFDFTFDCVKNSDVPADAAVIEGEVQMVGISNAEGKSIEYYWRNPELTPDARPKGGAKKKK